jgi:uncharacterized protein with ATP-grasp and redox domains
MMLAQPDCLVCAYRQALNTARIATRDPQRQLQVIEQLTEVLDGISLNQTPAALSQNVYRIVTQITRNRDPYAKIRRETNRTALRLLPELASQVRRARNPLHQACLLAVAGNIIDLGIGHRFNIERDVKAILRRRFAIDASAEFQAELKPGRSVLYLGDNSGEIVLDRILIEQLLAAGLRVTVSVKSGPIINDAVMADARMAGLTRIVPVITTGSDDIGVHWDHVSPEFRQAFESADLIISKGHANFETCTGQPGNIYFLLKTKCRIVAAELGVKLGDLVFAHQRNRLISRGRRAKTKGN